MLARTPATAVYLSAEELGITERERAGLIEVRDDLASGRVKHTPNMHAAGSEIRDPRATGFNMRYWQGTTACGTCHCIGGFMAARGVFSRPAMGDPDRDSSKSLDALFYCAITNPDNFTPAQAVRAIDHFLAGAGSECWPMALADIPPA